MQCAHRRNHGERKERLHRQITRRYRVCFRVRRQRNVVRRYGNEPHGAHDAQLAFRRPGQPERLQISCGRDSRLVRHLRRGA